MKQSLKSPGEGIGGFARWVGKLASAATRRTSIFLKSHLFGMILLGVLTSIISAVVYDRYLSGSPDVNKLDHVGIDDEMNVSELISVESSLVDYILLTSSYVQPRDTLRIHIGAHSSNVRARGLFELANGGVAKVQAKYNPDKGGVYIHFPIPATCTTGLYSATVYVQALKGMEEHEQKIYYHVGKAAPSKSRGDKLSVDDFPFVSIPGTSFKMGSIEGYRDERPVHEVQVDDFYIMKHEMSSQELHFLIKEIKLEDTTKVTPYEDFILLVEKFPEKYGEAGKYPIEVTFAEALTIAAMLGKVLGKNVRLPTEAEWEFAARGGLDGKEYPWGNYSDSVGEVTVENIVDKVVTGCTGYSGLPIRPIETAAPPNGFGLYDVAGNMWEWTSSRYEAYPYSASDGRENQNDSLFRVIRGGGRAPETCTIRVALRGYGRLFSRYGVRFVFNK